MRNDEHYMAMQDLLDKVDRDPEAYYADMKAKMEECFERDPEQMVKFIETAAWQLNHGFFVAGEKAVFSQTAMGAPVGMLYYLPRSTAADLLAAASVIRRKLIPAECRAQTRE